MFKVFVINPRQNDSQGEGDLDAVNDDNFEMGNLIRYWEHALCIGNQKIWVKVTPSLLNVILDSSLTFNAHLKKLTASLSSILRIVRAIAHTSWDWCHSTLKIPYRALICSNFDYAAPAWQPWRSTSKLSFFDSSLASSCLHHWTPYAWMLTRNHTCSNQLILKARE